MSPRPASRVARIWALLGAEFLALRRDRWTTLSLVLMTITLGALPHFAPLLEPHQPPPDEQSAAASWACAPGEIGAIAIVGPRPHWLKWPDPVVAEGAAEVLLRISTQGAATPEIDVLALTPDAPLRRVRRCVDHRVAQERRRRLDDLGITEGRGSIVALVSPTDQGLLLAPVGAAGSRPVQLGAALATSLFMLLVSLYLELGPSSRASGWVEAWLALPGHRSDLVWAWWLVGVLVGTAGVALTLAGHSMGAAWSGLPTQHFSWITVPTLIVLASALGLRAFIDVEDMRTAITRSVPVIFGVAVLGGIALALEQRWPGVGGLVPVAGLGLAMAGRTTATGLGLAIASSMLATGSLLVSSIHTLEAIPGRIGAMTRTAARRAAGNYRPEVVILTLIALAGSSVWAPAALMGKNLVIATFISMLGFIAAPAVAIASPLGLSRRALLSWRAPPRRAWLLLPVVTAGTISLAVLLWAAAAALLPQNGLIQAYSESLQAFDSPLGLVAVSILPGLCEELLFRGAILGLLREGTTVTIAVIVQALLFAALHGMAVRFPYTFGLGLVFGLLVVRTGSLWPGIVVHSLHNLLSTLLGDSLPGPESPILWLTAVVGLTAVWATGSKPQFKPQSKPGRR